MPADPTKLAGAADKPKKKARRQAQKEEAQGEVATFTPMPAIVVDPPFDLVALKLYDFREALHNPSSPFHSPAQAKNLEYLIRYYENGGAVPPCGETMWLLDGKVVGEMPREVPEGSAMWGEEVCYY